MSSADAAFVICDFLRRRGGSASAGEVVAHAAEHGLAASTVRRAAAEYVTKVRRGNHFVWTVVEAPEADPVTEGGDVETMQREVLEDRARHLGVDLDAYWPELTDEELQAVVEDAEEGIFDDPAMNAPSPTPSKRRKAPSPF